MTTLSRRDFAALVIVTCVASFLPDESVRAAPPPVPSGLGNQLELYTDLGRGYQILRPSGWNEFDGTSSNEQYDKKFQDIIQPLEYVTILSVPVSRNKSVDDLGAPDVVGARLAEKREARLVSASRKESNGLVAYVFEYAREPAHQLTLLTINKGKLFSVNASASEQRWSRREKILRAVVDSFTPHL